ncbi:lipoyl synthase [Coprothermobacter proteolyticus]|uniref:lipoyl synthase n=1 Tax=Coprothermobacter proteolyticus TaxID=35786 RepID=UPI000D306A41|nr:lipoyl synthase [Coprothermobacter proteolyticus]
MDNEQIRKPAWIKTNLKDSETAKGVRQALEGLSLNTICVEGRCPNVGTCFNHGTATFLIMGSICTRHCLYCNVQSGKPMPLDETEPQRVAEAVKRLRLKYVVLTSVTRDDLEDGGSAFFRQVVEEVKKVNPNTKVEALVPDFKKNEEHWKAFITPQLDVFAHNVEVVRPLFPKLRPAGDLDVSLSMLKYFKSKGFLTKTGFMVGVGESMEDIVNMLEELLNTGVDIVTIGQYLQPSKKHWPVHKYYTPEEFKQLSEIGQSLGIPAVVSGPMVRSSYLADQYFSQLSEPHNH